MPKGIVGVGVFVALSLFVGAASAEEIEHFDPKGKPPSKHTIEIMKQLRETLPFADERDFEEADRGFI